MAKLLLFGRLADGAGWRERHIAAGSIGSLRAALAEETPEIAAPLLAGTTTIVVNGSVQRGDMPLADDDEVAFLPPMSGG